MKDRLTIVLLALTVMLGACTDLATPERNGNEPAAAMIGAEAALDSWPLQRSGLTLLNERPFNSKARHATDLAGSEGWSPGESRFPNIRILEDAAAPHSPSSVMEFRYPEGMRNGSVGGAHFHLRGANPELRTVYAAFWLRLSENFVGHRTGSNTIASAWIAGSPRLTFTLRGTGSGNLVPLVQMAGRGDGRSTLASNEEGSPEVKRGAWQLWELMLVASTPGAADGVLVWWLDGKQVMAYDDLRLLSSRESDRWEWLYVEPTWGWGSGDALTQAISIRVDHARIAGSTARLTAPTPAPEPDPEPAPVVHRIEIQPAGGTLAIGATLQLQATAYEEDGSTIDDAVMVWSTSNPAVATVIEGLVSGISAGDAYIRASVGAIRDEVRFTVEAPAPPPEQPPTISYGDTVFAESFESRTLSAWHDGVDPTRHRIVTVPSLVRSGSAALEITTPQGGNGGYLNRFFMPGYDSLHVSYWIMLENDWLSGTYLVGLYGSRIDNRWSAHGKAGVCPNGSDFFSTFLFAQYDANPGATRLYSYFPGMKPQPDGRCYGNTGDGTERYHAPTNLQRGVWQRVEFWVRANTPGQSNGSQMFWVDGVLRGEWHGMRFRETTDLRLNSLQITAHQPFGSPRTQRMYIDDIVVTTAGSSASPPPPLPPPVPAPVASVSLNPTAASVVVGESRQFTATLRDAQGNVLTGRSISWSSSNGFASVTQSGTVTGVAAGSAVIVATSEGQIGSATVTVSAAAPTPPPPSGSCSAAPPWSCEPSGMTPLVNTHFRSLTSDGWSWQQKQQPGYARIAEDLGSPMGSPALELGFPAGFSSAGVSPGAMRPPRTVFPDPSGARNYRELYWGFTWKANAEWHNHGSGINKIAFAWLNNQMPFSWVWAWEGNTGRKVIRLHLGGQIYGANAPSAVSLEPGQWYRIEVYFRPSSATGVADGQATIWVNGILHGDHRNMVTTPGYFSDAYFDPTWGGLGGPDKNSDDYFRISHTRLSAR